MFPTFHDFLAWVGALVFSMGGILLLMLSLWALVEYMIKRLNLLGQIADALMEIHDRKRRAKKG